VTPYADSGDPFPNGGEDRWSLWKSWWGPLPNVVHPPMFHVSVTISNAGAGTAKVFPGISITSNGARVESSPRDLTAITLAPGSQKKYAYKFDLLKNGTYKLAVKVIPNVGLFQAESNVKNNSCDWQYTVTRKPESTAGEVALTTAKVEFVSVTVDEWWKVTARVKSTGTGPSKPFVIRAGFLKGGALSYGKCLRLRDFVMSYPSSIPPGEETLLSKVLFPQFVPGLAAPQLSLGEYLKDLHCLPTVGTDYELMFNMIAADVANEGCHVDVESWTSCGSMDKATYAGKRKM
jgi:hypothetical protein